ncbi:ECF transporter S component [Clostridium sp. Marseille-P299]|uniref:ECF transporter S component n=1 Tax=Clostridium sp. Marseille-P299 TaxID=1805477 RepID=UPI00082D81BD|nr:ECF transporter S component [Clostridium sp. Marseille-P299]
MKRVSTIKITTIALSAVINIVGAQIALMLKLPVYLDMIGTIFTAAILGPFYGIFPGLLSGLLTGISTDIFSLYFLPVQIITGIMAGLIFKTKWMKNKRVLFGAFLVSIPGTLVASMISAFLFGGVTSSGSSLIVMILRKIGFNEIASVFIVQIATDYLDRMIAVAIVLFLVSILPKDIIIRVKGTSYESIQ